jgi:hypothetical protein
MNKTMSSKFFAALFLTAAYIAGFTACASGPEEREYAELERIFENPPESARPGVLWMWMGCNISKEGITRDLEALRETGFNRTLMFSLADVTTPWPNKIYDSPTPEIIAWTGPWWELVRHAVLESKRLGMDFGMFNGPGYATSGGPWIPAELSMQETCFSQQGIKGGRLLSLVLERPRVDPRANHKHPHFNPETGLVEKPVIPERKTYYRDIAVLALPADGVVPGEKVIDLSHLLGEDGKLQWDAPAGDWIVYRFGHTTMGALLQPPQWEARGLECDKMNPEAVAFHINHVTGEIKKHLGDLVGKGFSFVHLDSYEAGVPGWTPKMREEFSERRGYDLTPFLPTLANRVIGSEEESNKFRNDFLETIKDLYGEVYFRTARQMLNEAGLEFSCEAYGGPWRYDDVMPSVERAMVEFWLREEGFFSKHLHEAMPALQKAGHNLIEAEAFTGRPMECQWSETPAWIKPCGDAAFCAGVNRFLLHRYVPQPWDDKYKPGNTMGLWGTHFDRTQTWWEPFKATVEYWQRCQALLQWGSFKSVPGDFEVIGPAGDLQLSFIHRSGEAADVYFLANTDTEASGRVNCSFAVEGMQPELWDPVWGTRRELPEFEQQDGQTLVPLEFAPTQSWFVVFRKKARDARTVRNHGGTNINFPVSEPVQEISGDWEVSFDPEWGGPPKVVFNQLEDWTSRPEPGIRYYSGTAVYKKVFDLELADNRKLQIDRSDRLFLDLGTINHIARIRLNGEDLGVAWCEPWRVNIPAGLLRPSGNELEIEVTNTWANRLIGDEQEPADCEWAPGHHFENAGSYLVRFPDWFLKGEPRPSSGRYCFTTWNYFTKDSPLMPSGLTGPVRLIEMTNKP